MMVKKITYHSTILLLASVIFFVVYNYLNITIPGIYNSPDETATYVFIQQVVEHTSLRYALPYDYGILSEFIHPRSTYVTEGIGTDILPVGFWYMMALYGMIGKIIGLPGTLYITPVLAIFSAWALYAIVKKIWDEDVGFLSALLFFANPVVWYYSSRSLFVNVPFVSLLVISAWFFVLRPIKKYVWLNDIIGMMICMSGALMRPNELPWIALVFLSIMLYFRKQILFIRVISWTIVSVLMIVLYAYINNIVYADVIGSYIVSRSIELPHWYQLLFPFGIHPRMMIASTWFYMIKLFWWYSVPAVIGGLLCLKQWNKLSPPQRVWIFVTMFVGIYLIAYYGSNQDTLYSLKTIGVAYVRYWLPVFVLLIPFVATLITRIMADYTDRVHTSKKFVIQLWLATLCLLFVLLGIRVVYQGIDGIMATKAHMALGQEVRNWVLAETDERAILVSDTHDKFFWPDRQVMVKFDNLRVREAIPALIDAGFPVYYFSGVLSDDALQSLNNELQVYGVAVSGVKMFDVFGVYEFIR